MSETTGGNRDLQSGEAQDASPVKAAQTSSVIPDIGASGFQAQIVMLIITMAKTISITAVSAYSVASMVLVCVFRLRKGEPGEARC